MSALEEKGRSMIEMLGVLAIIGVLSVGGISGYTNAMMKYKINKLIEQNEAIAVNLMEISKNERNYGFLGSEADDIGSSRAILIGAIPDEMIKGNKIFNVFGGEVKICATDYDDLKDGAFVIINNNLPRDASIALGMNVHSESNPNLVYIKINE